jgi:hypothetical protein
MCIDLIVDDMSYHNTFILKEPCCSDKSSKPQSQVPAAASAQTNNAGTVWNFPFNWLCKSYGDKGIKTWWKQALGGNGICLICHREEPKHVPKDCGLLKALNLKLVNLAPAASSLALPPSSSTPVAASPSPGGRMAFFCHSPTYGSAGSGMAPSGLTAASAITSETTDDLDSDDNF